MEKYVQNNLMDAINRYPLQEHTRDGWRWRQNRDGNFVTKKAYLLLTADDGEDGAGQDGSFVFSKIWSKNFTIRASTTVWRILWDRLPTRTNLHKRHILPQNSTMECPLCKHNSETVAHFFFYCSTSMVV